MPKSNETGTTASLYGNIGTAEPRHSPCSRKRKTSSRAAPFSPNREDDRALKSYSLFTSVVGSKMSNLSHHNSLPLTDPLALHAHTSAADKMFRLPDSGTPQITTTQTKGGRLFTSRLNDDDLQIWSATTFMFSGHPVAVYDPPKKATFNPFR